MFDSVWKIWLYELQMSSGPHHLPNFTQHDRSLYLDRPLHLGLASCASKRRECNWIQEGCSMNIHEHPWTSMNIHEHPWTTEMSSMFVMVEAFSRRLEDFDDSFWVPNIGRFGSNPSLPRRRRYVKICQDAIVLLFGLNETRVGHPEALGFLAPRPPKSISCFLSRPCSIISNMSQSETNPHIFTHGFDMDWK